MIVDASGSPVTSQKSAAPENLQQGKSNPILISSGSTEANFGFSNEKLKSLLISKITQKRSGAKNDRPIKVKTPALQKQSRYKEQPVYGKEYPGAHPLIALRAMAWSSTVVFSILTYRRHQLTKRQLLLVPREEEPSFRFHVLEYSASEIMKHPAFDDIDKFAILDLFRKIDPHNEHQRKLKQYEEGKKELSARERKLVDYYNSKHLNFHKSRNKHKKEIFSLLNDPDPYFSEESSWYYLLSTVLEDLLLIDRGVIIKVRNSKGEIIALTPVDGITIRPYVDETGFITHYVQVVDGEPTREYIPKEDVIIFRSNITGDVYMYGYGVPNMDVLWTTILSDLYIDKGNVDYYRKGGSVPEGFLSVSPPNNEEGIYVQFDKEELDGIQRQLQAIIMSDFTQVPIISGGKFEWIDLKGNRKDMQFKELAEYLIRKICAVFQVSPQDVGVLHDVNRACYSEDTETLTENGWKYYWEIGENEKIATFNPETQAIEYHVPNSFHLYPYKGEMKHFSSKQVDVLVTPDHDMWVKEQSPNRNTKNWIKKHAEALSGTFYFKGSTGLITSQEGDLQIIDYELSDKNVSGIDYEGYVYCFNVPNHLFVTRRNGRIGIHGNTAEQQSSLTKARGLETLAFTVSTYVTHGVIDEIRKEKDIKLWFKEDDSDKIKEWWATVQGQLQTGYKSINQAKSENGEDPVPWGDTPMQGLKNWNPEEGLGAAMEGGMPGAPGGAPGAPQLPPGLDQMSGGDSPPPLNIPGQTEGMAPSLGQPPAIKSVLTEMLSSDYLAEYDQMDVTPMVKSLLSDIPAAGISTELFDALHAPNEDDVIELSQSADYTIASMVKKVSLGFDHRSGLLSLEILTNRVSYKKENLLKLAMYLFRFSNDNHSIDVSPEYCQILLSDPQPLPALGESGTVANALTSILSNLNTFSQDYVGYPVRIRLLHDDITPGTHEVTPSYTLTKFINDLGTVDDLQMVDSFFSLTDDDRSLILDRISELLKKNPQELNERKILRLAVTKELANKVVDLLKEYRADIGDFYERLARQYKKHFNKETLYELGTDFNNNSYPDVIWRTGGYQNISKILKDLEGKDNSKKLALELVNRLVLNHWFGYSSYADDYDIKMAIISLFALEPKLEKLIDLEESVERVKEATEILYRLGESAAIDDATVPPTTLNLGHVLQDYYTTRMEGLSYDESLRDEIYDITGQLILFMENIELSNLDKKFEDLISMAYHQTRVLADAALCELEELSNSLTNLMGGHDIVIEIDPETFSPYQGEMINLDTVYEVVSDNFADNFEIQNNDILKSVVSKLIKNEDLDEFEGQLVDALRG